MKILRFLLTIGLIAPLGINAQQLAKLDIEKLELNLDKNSSVMPTQNPNEIEPQEPVADDALRSKTISKSFAVDRNDKLIISNQYGAILIKTWDKNEIKVDIDVRAYSNSESDAQKLIDGVTIDAGKSGSEITFKTNIAERNGSFSSIIKNGSTKKRREVKVNYVVYMPAVNALQLSQMYGNIEIGNFNGPTAIRLQYGTLKIGSLNNSNNYINVQYGKSDLADVNAAVIKHSYGTGLTIGQIGTLDLNASYVGINIGTVKRSVKVSQEYGSGLTIANVLENLTVDAQYTKINLGTVKGASIIKSDYGNITASNLANARINTDYSTISIGNLSGDANIKMSYNSININNVLQSCKNLVFECEYVNIGLGFSDQFGGSFIAETAYGSFKSGDNVTFKVVNSTNTSKDYKGKIGSSGSSNVSIKTTYGSVNFK